MRGSSIDSRQRIDAILNFRMPDRIGIYEWYWDETIRRWKKEGLPLNIDPAEHFGLDIVNLECDLTPRFPEEIIREEEETVIKRDNFGITARWWRWREGPPQFMDYAVKTYEDWEVLRERLRPDESRWSVDTAQRWRDMRRRGRYVCYFCWEPFEYTLRLVGMARQLTLMHTDPEWLGEMYDAGVDLAISQHEMLRKYEVDCDGAFVGGDIAYKAGPMFSPALYREILMPRHRRLFSYFRGNNMPVIYHTDGDIHQLIDLLLESGVTAIHPLEAKAGMDVRTLKPKYHGRLVFFGNIDVRAVSGTREDIDRELMAKIPIAMDGGGYVYCVDHSVASSVSLDNYLYLLQRVREIGLY